jgi:hypothetical protein
MMYMPRTNQNASCGNTYELTSDIFYKHTIHLYYSWCAHNIIRSGGFMKLTSHKNHYARQCFFWQTHNTYHAFIWYIPQTCSQLCNWFYYLFSFFPSRCHPGHSINGRRNASFCRWRMLCPWGVCVCVCVCVCVYYTIIHTHTHIL